MYSLWVTSYSHPEPLRIRNTVRGNSFRTAASFGIGAPIVQGQDRSRPYIAIGVVGPIAGARRRGRSVPGISRGPGPFNQSGPPPPNDIRSRSRVKQITGDKRTDKFGWCLLRKKNNLYFACAVIPIRCGACASVARYRRLANYFVSKAAQAMGARSHNESPEARAKSALRIGLGTSGAGTRGVG